MAFVGCDNPNLLQQGGKKDVAAATNNNNTGWKNTPQGGQTGTPVAGTSGATGNNVANTGGSFNVNPRGPVGDYPEGRSMPVQPASSGGVEQVAYPGTSGANMKAISPSPVADPSTGGLPALTKPLPTGGVPDPNSRPFGTLPPLTPSGPAHPRVDELPLPPTSHAPVVVPTTSGRPTSGASDAGSPATPPLPPVVSPETSSPADLPPIPPPPMSPTTKALQSLPLPSAPVPTGMGIPMAPTKNQAGFQQ